MNPKFFPDQQKFRQWLEKNHQKKDELLVGFHKVSSGKPSMTWPESVDQAICFGWIDGIRRSINESSYSIRFTPRKPGSTWSAVNIKKVEKLKKLGLMAPAGLEAYARRQESNSVIYSFEQENVGFAGEYAKIFRRNKKAWENFISMAPYYRKVVTHWVMSAKREETQLKRLNTLIEDSARGVKIKEMRREGK